jgi:hypothetical protein
MFLLTTMSCSTSGTGILDVDKEGNTTIDNKALTDAINQQPVQQLDEIEKEGILYMREEEKLARDVYLRLYELWGTNNFNNIGSSEQTHMDSMKLLIDRYNLQDPAEGKGQGEFANQDLQQLYNDLIAKGNKAEIEALNVGAAIEEIDIIDLEEYVAQTNKEDIITVYNNLMKGSRNHLRSFVSVLEKRGVTYKPQYLTTEQYEAIITTSIEKGKR